MEIVKREVQLFLMSEYKWLCNGVFLVKKIIFSRCESICVLQVKDDEIWKNCSFNMIRSKSLRWSILCKSFRESDVCVEKRIVDIVDDMDYGLLR